MPCVACLDCEGLEGTAAHVKPAGDRSFDERDADSQLGRGTSHHGGLASPMLLGETSSSTNDGDEDVGLDVTNASTLSNLCETSIVVHCLLASGVGSTGVLKSCRSTYFNQLVIHARRQSPAAVNQ